MGYVYEWDELLMADIRVSKHDEVYMRIDADSGIKQELADVFAFYAPNYQFNPKFKAKIWDGKIRLFSPFKPLLYIGLLEELKEFADLRDYTVSVDPELIPDNKITEDDVLELCEEIGATLVPRDYQVKYVLNALNTNRSISLSPTSSGKSFIQYLIQQFYYRAFECRTLLVVPTVSLVLQMQADFIDYGCDPEQIHTIKAGADKNSKCPIQISTWQSLQNMPKEWFQQFKVILGDEAHLFAAKSLIGIMENLASAEYRHGFSGTIPKDAKTNKIVLQGLFGKIFQVIKTKDLINDGTVAEFKIKAIVLNYPKEVVDAYHKGLASIDKKKHYWAEKEFLFANERRNRFLTNLVGSLNNANNLILFDAVEKHGKVLEPMFQFPLRQLHFIYGDVSGEKREEIRNMVENDPVKQHNLLASYQVFSTGINLKKLDNLIFASGSKSEVRVLQSIGRTLRKGNGSDNAVLYDIVDNLTKGSKVNYTMQHFQRRVDFYAEQELDFKIINVDLI